MNYDLPEGWTLVKLPDVCTINPPKPAADALSPDASVTFVPMPAVDAEQGAITSPQARPFSEVRKGFTAFRDEDVIMAKITPCMENGKAAIARGLLNGLGFGSTEFHVLRCTGAVLPEYVYFFVRQESFRRAAEEEMTGSVGQKRVPAGFFEQTQIPFAPLAEQERMVRKVEALLARLNAARKRLAKVPAILKRFRQSVLADACCGRLTADWREAQRDLEPAINFFDQIGKLRRERYDDACQQANRAGRPKPRDYDNYRPTVRDDLILDDLPGEWAWVDFRFLMDEQQAFCYGVVQPGKDDPDGVFLIRAGDLDAGTVNTAELRRIPRTVDGQYPRSKVKGGELLITVVGAGIGAVAIVPDACAGFNIARAVAKVPIRDFSVHYIFHWLNSATALTWLKSDSREVARPTLNLEQLKTLPVPLPPFVEQREIVRRVEVLFRLADAIQKRIAAGMARVAGLMETILAKAFRGELVPTEAELARRERRDYEPASALLERIRAGREWVAGNEPRGGEKNRR